MQRISRKPLTLVIALGLAIVLLHIMNGRNGTTSRVNNPHSEDVDIKGIPSPKRLMQHLDSSTRYRNEADELRLLWLGNSQLHSIVDKVEGDFLGSYWLKLMWPERCHRLNPLVVSLPSSNPQEHLVLAHYVFTQRSIDILVVAVTLNDFRQDELRQEISELFTDQVKQGLSQQAAGKTLVSSTVVSHAVDYNLTMEEFLSSKLSSVSTLWQSRPALKQLLFTDLFHLRNWFFNVKPTAIRKVIKPRYEKNMQALIGLLEATTQRGTKVVIYIAPIRQDFPLPYDASEYQTFKKQIGQLALSYSALFLDLDRIIPNELWNTKEIDYMHFKGDGHKVLASQIMGALRLLGCSLPKDNSMIAALP